MDFDEWLLEQDRARKTADGQSASDDAIRCANAARVVDALTQELLSVVSHLRAFPSVMVQEDRVDVTVSVSGTVAIQRLHGGYDVMPAAEVSMQRSPVGAPHTAWRFKHFWLDDDGHLWFERTVSAGEGLYKRGDPEPRSAQLREQVMIPVRASDIERWVGGNGENIVRVTLNGRPWSDGATIEVDGVPLTRHRIGSPTLFYRRKMGLTLQADLLRDDALNVFLGLYEYDAPAIVVRDFIFETVQRAVQPGGSLI